MDDLQRAIRIKLFLPIRTFLENFWLLARSTGVGNV